MKYSQPKDFVPESIKLSPPALGSEEATFLGKERGCVIITVWNLCRVKTTKITEPEVVPAKHFRELLNLQTSVFILPF